MIVVADTGPINYLVLIQHVDILPRLYQRVLIPSAVARELSHPNTPAAVRAWVKLPPVWLEIEALTLGAHSKIPELDEGETEAIHLAERVFADRIVMDESLGRRVATARGLQVIGTLGILREASRQGLLDLREAVDRLKTTRFHIAQIILDDVLADA